eukprot:1139428-Pelagomonas_calceolata.AAC.2
MSPKKRASISGRKDASKCMFDPVSLVHQGEKSGAALAKKGRVLNRFELKDGMVASRHVFKTVPT